MAICVQCPPRGLVLICLISLSFLTGYRQTAWYEWTGCSWTETLRLGHSFHHPEGRNYRYCTMQNLSNRNILTCIRRFSCTQCLTGDVRMPSGKVAKPDITDNKDGTVTVKYAPTEAGLHEMDIKYDGIHIPGKRTCTWSHLFLFPAIQTSLQENETNVDIL